LDRYWSASRPYLTDSLINPEYSDINYFNEFCKQANRNQRKIICMYESRPIHERWMNQALEAAQLALPVDVPVGAVLLHQGAVIAQGYNRRELDCDPVGHAEILVLREAALKLGNWRLRETILYVTLEPCPMCASAIQQARVGHIIFGAYDPLMGACGSRFNLLPSTLETSVLGGILEAPCSELLKAFFQRKRRSV
jgi:tRNA(adenine34) deaminase